jgi:hypothetical protein
LVKKSQAKVNTARPDPLNRAKDEWCSLNAMIWFDALLWDFRHPN